MMDSCTVEELVNRGWCGRVATLYQLWTWGDEPELMIRLNERLLKEKDMEFCSESKSDSYSECSENLSDSELVEWLRNNDPFLQQIEQQEEELIQQALDAIDYLEADKNEF